MYPAAQATIEGRLLVEGMLGEHEILIRLPGEVAEAADPRRAAASATMLLERGPEAWRLGLVRSDA